MSNSFSLPPQSAEIFNQLSRGLFISRNAPGSSTLDLYRIVDIHFEKYQNYFRLIGFELEKGENYFFFSQQESRGQIEDKAEKLFRYLQGLEILYLIEPKLDAGMNFNLLDHEDRLNNDKSLRRKSLLLPGKIAQEKAIDRVRNFCRALEKESFFHSLDEQYNKFWVLDSFRYLVDFFIKIDQNS